jgi:hypothetical protein
MSRGGEEVADHGGAAADADVLAAGVTEVCVAALAFAGVEAVE